MDRHIKGPDALGMDPLDCLQASPYGRLKSNILYWRMRLEKHIDGDAPKANTANRSSVSRSSMVATFHRLIEAAPARA
jgi:hypothetical protein